MHHSSGILNRDLNPVKRSPLRLDSLEVPEMKNHGADRAAEKTPQRLIKATTAKHTSFLIPPLRHIAAEKRSSIACRTCYVYKIDSGRLDGLAAPLGWRRRARCRVSR